MDLAYLKKLIKLVEKSGVDEIEVEEDGLRVRVARNAPNNFAASHVVPVAAHVASAPAAIPAVVPAPPVLNVHEVKSPIVGTFYRAPAPDADEYVHVGQVVQAKTVLCIIEAMKLMNEIESDIGGRVVKCLVENGQPVEYNQPLFIIEPA